MFTEAEYNQLHSLVFRSDYSGYKPTVVEIPNGDGKRDDEKKYAHVAYKYFADDWQRTALEPYLLKAHNTAVAAALTANIPFSFFPDIRYSALRVLDYPPGAVSNKHGDFDLFTLMLYRDQPDKFKSYDSTDLQDAAGYARRFLPIDIIRTVNPQAHLGQLGTEIGLGPATLHEVLPSETRQCSIVYFAIPDHDAVLPSGITVRDWLNERMERSRTEFKKYE